MTAAVAAPQWSQVRKFRTTLSLPGKVAELGRTPRRVLARNAAD
jgi:hypothetical protein